MKKVTMYIGLFDKDTKKQEISSDTALNLVMSWSARMFDGATVSNSFGVYKHDDGTAVVEPSIRVEVSNPDDSVIKEFIGKMKTSLNQENILKETTAIEMEFC